MANVSFQKSDEVLAAYLEGEIDHHSAALLRTKIDAAIASSAIKVLIMDFTAISFMDSSGVGLILGRHKLMSALGGRVLVQSAPQNIYKMLAMAGIATEEKGVKA
ncbi:MAG: anti-sigma factor antagonist [Oscillospiraceae bacterium]